MSSYSNKATKTSQRPPLSNTTNLMLKRDGVTLRRRNKRNELDCLATNNQKSKAQPKILQRHAAKPSTTINGAINAPSSQIEEVKCSDENQIPTNQRRVSVRLCKRNGETGQTVTTKGTEATLKSGSKGTTSQQKRVDDKCAVESNENKQKTVEPQKLDDEHTAQANESKQTRVDLKLAELNKCKQKQVESSKFIENGKQKRVNENKQKKIDPKSYDPTARPHQVQALPLIKPGKNEKAVRFEEVRSSTENCMKVLRKRKTRNYTELSQTESPEIQENREISYREHVPVYLQNKTEAQSRPQNDPFEFIADSPSRKKGKGKQFKQPWSALSTRKRDGVDDWSDSESSTCNKEMYDKEMHDILKKVRRKMAKNKNVGLVNHRQAVNNYKKIVARQNIVRLQKELGSNGLGSNIPVKAGPLNSKNKDTLNMLRQEVRRVSRRISDASSGKNAMNLRTDDDDGDAFFGFEDEADDGDISVVLPAPIMPAPGSTAVKQIIHIGGPDRFTLLTSTPLPRSSQQGSMTSPRPHINIISNVLVTPPRAARVGLQKFASPSTSKEITFEEAPSVDNFFGFDDNGSVVNAHSPQLRPRIADRPWRGDNLNVTRNPHWLAVKDTSLPCYNQEMILEPKLLEKPMKTPVRVEESQAVQTSILDFVSTSKYSPVKQSHNSSLFDCNNFSPIKDKDGVETRRPVRGKRNILGASNKDVLPPSSKELNVENCFGFDEGEGKENVRVTRAKLRYQKKEEARPMRVPMQQLKKIREEAAKELLKKANFEAPEEPVQPHDDTQPEKEEAAHVGLFEDFEQVQSAHRSYEPKRRKRVRFPSVDSIEEDAEEKPRRKRKDVRTPAEEAEFNKWAAAFNAMCAEVEQHSLETDSTL